MIIHVSEKKYSEIVSFGADGIGYRVKGTDTVHPEQTRLELEDRFLVTLILMP